jgi:hypothetical protein
MNELLAGLLKNVAPALATAVAGPLGGAAINAIANKLGVGETVEEITKALTVDPAAAQKLAELELEYAKLDMANTADARNMNAKIQESANASWVAKNAAYVLDFAIVSATIIMTWIVFFKGVPVENKEIAYMAIGSLITMCGTVLNFHRGSSAGSKSKTEEIMKTIK